MRKLSKAFLVSQRASSLGQAKSNEAVTSMRYASEKNLVSYFDQFSIIPRAIIQGQTGKTGKAQWNSNDAPSRCFTPLTIKSSRTGTYCLIRCQRLVIFLK